MSKPEIKTRVLHSETNNPWFNLATEDWIFREMDPDGHVLFLWSNTETVVIGRYQNPWIECRLDQMQADGVKLARRQSGGGAVYQDRKNLNFTFMSGVDVYDKDRNFEIIIDAIAELGINVETSGRNDMLCGGKKISGSAFKLTKDRAFHHGTLLVDVDLGRLQNYLNPDLLKLQSKGIKSVKSRVANLVEFNPVVNMDNLAAGITSSFFNRLGSGTEEVMNLDSLEKIPRLTEYYDTLRSEDWLYKKSPNFSHRLSRRFDWGGIEINIDVVHGSIAAAEIFTDSLYPEMIAKLEKALRDMPYHHDAVELLIADLQQDNEDWNKSLQDIGDMLLNEIKG